MTWEQKNQPEIFLHKVFWRPFSGGRRCLGAGRLGLPGSSGSCRLFLHFLAKIAVKKCLGKHLEVPDILLPDIRGLLTFGSWTSAPSGQGKSAQKNSTFLHSQRWVQSFSLGTSARISTWTSVGYPVPKLLCLGCYSVPE